MENTLVVQLVTGWIDISHENRNGPPTFVRENEGNGVLQISVQAEFVGGKQPLPTPEALVDLAERTMMSAGTEVEIRGRATGQCAIGHYGTALARVDDVSWFQIWVMSNGADFIMASLVCEDEPAEKEVGEASWIVKNTTLAT
jgi:hypothetical protein